jgi:hypothetical protein
VALATPKINSGSATTNPAIGPAAAMSNNALRDGIAPRIRITAPSVPTNIGGPGMKNGSVAGTL